MKRNTLDSTATNGDVSYDALNSDEFNGEKILIAELPDVCDTLVHQQLLDKLRKTVDALPEDEKALIVAHFYDEVPQTEVAFPCSGCRGQIRTKAKTIDTTTKAVVCPKALDRLLLKTEANMKEIKRGEIYAVDFGTGFAVNKAERARP